MGTVTLVEFALEEQWEQVSLSRGRNRTIIVTRDLCHSHRSFEARMTLQSSPILGHRAMFLDSQNNQSQVTGHP